MASDIKETLDAIEAFRHSEAGKELGRALDACGGSIDEPGLSISWHGACPVQGEGTIDGYPCYYRARDGGTFTVFALGTRTPIWESVVFDGDGWDEAPITEAFIRQEAKNFRDWKSGRED